MVQTTRWHLIPAVVLSTAVPLVGLWFLGWNPFVVLAIYFCESVIVGLVTLLKLRSRGWRSLLGFLVVYGWIVFLEFGFFMVSLDAASVDPVGVAQAPQLGFGLWWRVLEPFVRAQWVGVATSVAMIVIAQLTKYAQMRSTDAHTTSLVADATLYVLCTLPLLFVCTFFAPHIVLGFVLLLKAWYEWRASTKLQQSK